MRNKRLIGILALVAVLVLSMLPLATVAGARRPVADVSIRPIIFVHGFAGSGQQFESQAMRFASNRYPPSYITALEYDSSSMASRALVPSRLEALIDRLLAETRASQVDIVAHSLGTTLMIAFWNASSAAKVANYVAVDGSTSNASVVHGVRTLGLWAEIGGTGAPNLPRAIVGATNVVLPGQYHVEVATSAEGFATMHKFFTGNEPATTNIIPVPPGQVRLAGRAVFFPANQGVGDATLEIWEVHAATGARKYSEPAATYTLSGTGYDGGAWGPFKANGLKHYEFVLLREGFRPHHFYCEPFMRSNYLIRLQTSPPGGIGEQMDRSANHSNIVISRQNEWRNTDVLEMNGVNVLTAIPTIGKWIIGLFICDRSADGVSNLTAPIPFFHAAPFMSGVDFYMPAADPPDGTISVVVTPRFGGGKTQVINVPNWASSRHAISVIVNDFVQDIDSWPEHVGRRARGRR